MNPFNAKLRKCICRLAVYQIGLLLLVSHVLIAQIAVTTNHYDNHRTGWNFKETTLTPANVGSSSFGVLFSIPLDAAVNAQPLVVPNQQITAGNFQGKHDVVYVATEGNTIYAIDVHTGTVLLSPNFGPPLVQPFGCKNDPLVGTESTPVINLATNTMYVMIYTSESNGPVYRLHALDLGSLADQQPPVVVSASHTLTDGSTFNFDATYQRQRPALLMANGNIYAGFGSFCDFEANESRGWMLGWQATTLAPLPGNQLLDMQANDSSEFFLSSIWMSGSGPAADGYGNVYFTTGNSDPSGNSYDGKTNIQESAVKVSPDLTQVLDLFTPSNWGILDEQDLELGSGGIMLLPRITLPTSKEPYIDLAVADGKETTMFLMNQNDLGGYDPNNNNVLGQYSAGHCMCGASYFVDPSDLSPRVVIGAGTTIQSWKLQTSPTVGLTNVANSVGVFQRNHGAYTTVSSNGTKSPIIWAAGNPNKIGQNNSSAMGLFAFDPEAGGSTLKMIYSNETFGTWPYYGNAFTVPVVANGEVFVGSAQQLTIFGLTGNGVTKNRPGRTAK